MIPSRRRWQPWTATGSRSASSTSGRSRQPGRSASSPTGSSPGSRWTRTTSPGRCGRSARRTPNTGSRRSPPSRPGAPAGAGLGPPLLPGVPGLHRPRSADRPQCGDRGAAGPVRLPGRPALRRRLLRLPRAPDRHAARWRTLGGAGGQAHAQVARAPLHDLGVRAEALPGGDHRLCQHPRIGQGDVRRVLPDGAHPRTDLRRHGARPLPGRGVAQVPAGQRGQGLPDPTPLPRRVTGRPDLAARGGRALTGQAQQGDTVAPAGTGPALGVGVQLEYMPALDGLRAVAIASVLVNHGGFGWATERNPRGQRLLRPERLPDHPPVAQGVDPDGDHPTRRLLGQTRPAAASCAAGPPRRHPPLRLAVRPGRDPVVPARRRPEHALLRRELAPDRDRPELFRPRVRVLPAPPHLDPGHRGAVLRALATRGARSPDPPAIDQGPARGDPDRYRPLGPRDGPPLPQPDGSEPALLGDRHPGPGHPGRGRGRHPPQPEHTGGGPDGHPQLLGSGRNGGHRIRRRLVGDRERRVAPLPGRVPARRPPGGSGHPRSHQGASQPRLARRSHSVRSDTSGASPTASTSGTGRSSWSSTTPAPASTAWNCSRSGAR